MHFDFATFFTGGVGALMLSAAAETLKMAMWLDEPSLAVVFGIEPSSSRSLLPE